MCVWEVNLLDITAVVGAVGDSVAGDVIGSRHPAHPQHAVGDHRKLNTHWRWERDCGGKKNGKLLVVVFYLCQWETTVPEMLILVKKEGLVSKEDL